MAKAIKANTKANEITAETKANDANEVAKVTPIEDTRFTPQEVANMIANLLISIDKNGDILVANTPEEDSIANNRRFVKAITAFIEAVNDGNGYDAISALTEICTNPRYQSELDSIVSFLCNRNSDYSYWIRNTNYSEWHFNDALLNVLWNLKTFNRRAAISLYGMVSYLTDMTFHSIIINNYHGDIACLGAITQNCSVLFREDWEK